MSLLNTSTLLPLDTFRSILGFGPYAFWGMANADVPIDSQCSTPVYEHSYQNSSIAGRSEIRQAIANAEARLRGYLAFPVAPQYAEAIVKYPQYYNQQFQRYRPIDPTGGWVSVQLPDGYIEAIGIESLTLIGTEAVGYSDQFSTGVYDTFDIAFPTTETDPTKIAVYFAAADRIDSEPVSEAYRIQPVQVDITGGVCTVTGRAWLLVQPILYQGFKRAVALDPSNTSIFVTTLEAYVRTTDPNGTTVDDAQGNFIWDSVPAFNWNWWGFCCNTGLSDPASVAKAVARVGIRNSTTGIVIPGEAIYNTTTQQWLQTVPPWSALCIPPVQVTVRYKAGYPLDSNGQMDARLARAVAYLAMADMPDRICACDAANRTLEYYQQELNRTGNIQQETFATTRQMLNNPLGNRRGHWYAWNEMNALKLTRGV